MLLGTSLLGWGIIATAQASDDSSVDAENEVGVLVVHIDGLESADGNLRFSLFDSKKNFMKRPIRAEIVQIADRQGTWTVEDLPFGEYAVLVHHDVNGNGEMERHWYGPPKEPSGASNDAPAKLGPPKYKDAKFQLDAPELTMRITLR